MFNNGIISDLKVECLLYSHDFNIFSAIRYTDYCLELKSTLEHSILLRCNETNSVINISKYNVISFLLKSNHIIFVDVVKYISKR